MNERERKKERKKENVSVTTVCVVLLTCTYCHCCSVNVIYVTRTPTDFCCYCRCSHISKWFFVNWITFFYSILPQNRKHYPFSDSHTSSQSYLSREITASKVLRCDISAYCPHTLPSLQLTPPPHLKIPQPSPRHVSAPKHLAPHHQRRQTCIASNFKS